jgi:hypothetical protein
MKKTTKQSIQFAIVIATALASAALIAGGKANADESCKANIVATLGGKPAMKSMVITVTRGGSVITSTSGQHSISTALNCGDYNVTVSGGGITRSRKFTAGSETTVNVPMDN